MEEALVELVAGVLLVLTAGPPTAADRPSLPFRAFGGRPRFFGFGGRPSMVGFFSQRIIMVVD